MPPKHRLGRKHITKPPNLRKKQAQSSKSNKTVVHSTIQDSCEKDNKSSLDSPSIPFTTDEVTITANDRQYVRVSKQILQNELRRKRMNVEPMLEQAHLEGDEITLPTSTTSDWRLVLQDSITTDDLREGCISLFEQVNSGKKLTPNEVFHAVYFLEYATKHIEHGANCCSSLLENIFPEDEDCQTKLMPALLKIVCYPSDKLRAVVLSLFVISLSHSRDQFLLAVAATGLLPSLFERLKPHEIPLNRMTLDFHRHFTSIVDRFFYDFTPKNIRRHPEIEPSSYRPKTFVSEIINPIFRLLCTYLQNLIAFPVCPTDYYSGISLVSKMGIFDQHITRGENRFTNQVIQHFFVELRKNMTKELVSSLNLAMAGEKLSRLLFGDRGSLSDNLWVQIFENILVGLSEGRHLSDLGLQAFLCFLSQRPTDFRLEICSDGTYSIKKYSTLVSSIHLPSNPFCTLFNTAPFHRSVSILDNYYLLTYLIDFETLVEYIWNDWFSTLFHALTPSTLPFTSDFLPLHKQLISLMDQCLITIGALFIASKERQVQSEPCHVYNTFIEQKKDYLVCLSLHPFVLDSGYNKNVILDFFERLFEPDSENSLTMPFRENLRKGMDEAALLSSSPPFILTSELVCRLTDEEIMNVVDRIVALLESDSPISDDTILRICAFHTNQLKCVYLPELFRKAGRSTEQCFHTFECLLSLPVDDLDRRPANSLLKPKPKTLQPTLDEWDDVDLATVGIVMRKLDKYSIPMASCNNPLEENIRDFVIRSVRQVRHRAVRLNQPHLEQLLAPSIDFLGNFLVEPSGYSLHEKECECHKIIDVCKLGDQRVIAQCFSRIGFFSRIVCGLLDDRTSFDCEWVMHAFLIRPHCPAYGRARRKTLRNPIEHFLEEGWQDVLEFIFVKKNVCDWHNTQHKRYLEMMGFHGANLNSRISCLFHCADQYYQDFNNVFEKKVAESSFASNTEFVHLSFDNGLYWTNGLSIVSKSVELHGNKAWLTPRMNVRNERIGDTDESTIRQTTKLNHPERWMMEVQNSSLTMQSWKLDAGMSGSSVCFVEGSSVEVIDSEILSNMECSGFVLADLFGSGSSRIVIVGSSHESSTPNVVLPLVGRGHRQLNKKNDEWMADWEDWKDELMERETIIGVGLLFDSTHFALGTGPLFSFGGKLLPVGSKIGIFGEVSTELRSTSISNVTSSFRDEKGKNMGVGSCVWERMVGSKISRSMNHDIGTGLCGTRLGGNIACVNTSFSSCVRTSNSDVDIRHENITQTYIKRTSVTSSSGMTSVRFTLCTFNDMTVSGGRTAKSGGSAIYLNHSASPLTVTQCFFHKCSCTEDENDGGAICVWEAGSDCPITISLSSFTECENTGGTGNHGGSVYCCSNSTVSISDCFFEESKSKYRHGALSLWYHSLATLSNCAFVNCESRYEAGAMELDVVTSIDFSFLQFRNCTATKPSHDINFFRMAPEILNSNTIRYCDSTSGVPNVYDDWSIFRTAVVSSGVNGVLPDAECKLRSSSLATSPPPSFTKVEFVFTNSLGTGCTAVLTGTDLVDGTEYEVKLNTSHTFSIVVKSSTRAESSEMPIGFEGALACSADILVETIEPTDEEGGVVVIPSPFTGQTQARPNVNEIFVDTETGQTNQTCGDSSRPCSTMDVAWKIMRSLGISHPTFSLLTHTSLSSQMTIESGFSVLIQNGTNSGPSLHIPSSAAESATSALIVVSSAVLNIHEIDIVVESSKPSFVLISASSSKMTLKYGLITVKSESTRSRNERDDLCLWTTGLIELIGTELNVTHNNFFNISQGVIRMKGGELDIQGSIFTNNSLNDQDFPSNHQNIGCAEDGKVTISSLGAGDGSPLHPSAWILSDACTIESTEMNPDSPLFIPTLSSESTSKLDKKAKSFTLTIEGTILIPCSLFLKVFEMGKDGTEAKSTQIPLTVDSATSFAETKIVLTLPSSSLKSLDSSLEWRGRLVFGENQTTNNTFLIQQSSSGRFAQALKDNMKWWIPLVVVVSCALLALILLVILYLRRRNKKAGNNQNDGEQQELNQTEVKIDVLKDEGDIDDNRNSVNTAGHKQLKPALTFHEDHSHPSLQNTHEIVQTSANQAPVLNVGEDQFGQPKLENGFADSHDTLFNRLHGRERKTELNIYRTRLDVAKTVEKLLSLRPNALALRKLNPHWVFYTPSDAICFRLSENTQSQAPTSTPTQSGEHQETQEEKRWSAPEEENRENGIDEGKVTVFRLGLILWEITTGQVPFSETDAVNAQRQLGMGIVPGMDSVDPAELATLLLDCLDLNPVCRPSLESVVSRLESIGEGKKEEAGDLLELPNHAPEPKPESRKQDPTFQHE
ncbi:hypothetical protein BLNAU_3057 [Blattamonas nauphoetae]|uniref:Protein kinase domain-containing protein n=1 Tax=Blattamonas nauphoetae TaxID=2049346 RepID=A0ABQ9YED1_9EUKA|nr:hypothetical protein BLNAU_3057 [Blattamonas nauphoetae]